jgi:parallel beta-helix repeat protein
MRKFFFFLFLLGGCGFFRAMFEPIPRGVGSVKGTVYYQGTPVAGVIISAGEKKNQSSSTGQYVLKNLPLGTYLLKIEKPGFLPAKEYQITITRKLLVQDIELIKGTIIPGGEIKNGTHWQVEESPYLVQDHIYLNHLSQLEIEPGVEIKFAAGKSFRLKGRVSLRSRTPSAPPKLTNWKKGTFWQGIILEGSGGWVEGVIIENAHCGIMIEENAQIKGIYNNIIKNCQGYGIEIRSNLSNDRLERNTIKNNRKSGIFIYRAGVREITNNQIISNYGHGLEIQLFYLDGLKLKENEISNNQKCGLWINPQLGPLKIEKNNFCQNQEWGIYNSNSENKISFENCYFFGNQEKELAEEGKKETYQWNERVEFAPGGLEKEKISITPLGANLEEW